MLGIYRWFVNFSFLVPLPVIPGWCLNSQGTDKPLSPVCGFPPPQKVWSFAGLLCSVGDHCESLVAIVSSLFGFVKTLQVSHIQSAFLGLRSRRAIAGSRTMFQVAKGMGFVKQEAKYANLWFASLARFHKIQQPTSWEFEDQDVIQFLRAKFVEKVPAWKRLEIVEGLLWYRNHVRLSSVPSLEHICEKLREMRLCTMAYNSEKA